MEASLAWGFSDLRCFHLLTRPFHQMALSVAVAEEEEAETSSNVFMHLTSTTFHYPK